MAQVQALACTRDGHIHQTTFFLQAFKIAHGVFMRKQTFFQAGDKHAIEFQTFGGVHRHELHCILTCLRLVVARFQSRMAEKCRKWRQGFTRVCVWLQRCTGCSSGSGLRSRKVSLALQGFINWQGHRVFAETFLRDKTLGRIDQLLQVLHPVRALALGLVMLYQLAVV